MHVLGAVRARVTYEQRRIQPAVGHDAQTVGCDGCDKRIKRG